jgi:hypothetical protein
MAPHRLAAVLSILAALTVAGCGGDGDEKKSVSERLATMFQPECEEDGGIYDGVVPASPIVLADLARRHGSEFKAVIDKRALEANLIGCSVAGGGLMHFLLTSRQAASRASAAYSGGAVCRYGRDIFDSDYVNGADDQVVRFCKELGGRVIR